MKTKDLLILPMKTSFKELNNIINGGYLNGDLVIIYAESGHGKTSFIINDLLFNSMHGFSILFNSLELTNSTILLKMICIEACISFKSMISMSAQEWIEYTNVAAKLAELKMEVIHISDINNLIEDAKAFKETEGLHLLAIDSLQLMCESDESSADVIKKLKHLAIKLNIPIIITTHFMNQTIRNVADIIIEIDREVLRFPNCENPASANLIVNKNRNGILGEVNLHFIRELGKFEEI